MANAGEIGRALSAARRGQRFRMDLILGWRIKRSATSHLGMGVATALSRDSRGKLEKRGVVVSPSCLATWHWTVQGPP
eukprot:5472360-Pyramimonas_sp.AAC.1